MVEEKIISEEIVPISFDMVFKKMWGDADNIQRTEALLSIMLGVPYEIIKGKLEVIDSEKRIKNKKNKRQRYDVIVKVNLNAYGKVNLEMNLGFDKTDIDRNVSFLTAIFNNGITHKMKYSKILPVLQINFNDYDIDENTDEIIDKYYFQNKRQYMLTEKLQIWNINIAKCYKLWYNDGVESLNEKEKEIVKICALMNIDNRKEFIKCLEGIEMDKELKEDIKIAEEDFSSDEEILEWYGSEEEYEALEQAKLENAKAEARDEGMKQGKIVIAKNLLSQKVAKDIISVATGLSIEEINNLE